MRMKLTRAIALALPFFAIPAAFAHDFQVGDLKIEHPWARATPKGAKVGGGFMRITNTGKEADRLIGGSAEVSSTFEVHEMKMDGNVMKMRALEKGLEIKPGQTIELKPGSYHVMFMGLKNPLTTGESVKGQLEFQKAGKVNVEYKIEDRGSSGAHNAKTGHQH